MHQGRHRLRLLRQAGEAARRGRLRADGKAVDREACASTSRYPRRAVRRRPRCTGITHLRPALIEPTAPAAAATSASPPSPRSWPPLAQRPRPRRRAGRTLQDTNDHFLANMQSNGTYSVVPRIPGGEITPEKLIVIGEVARTSASTRRSPAASASTCSAPASSELPADLAAPGRRRVRVRPRLRQVAAHGEVLRRARPGAATACRTPWRSPSSSSCATAGLRAPHKLKSAVSGCARECAEARGKDFGVIATEKGWNLYVGGNGGIHPGHAELLAGDLDAETLIRYHRPLPDVLHPHRRPAAAHRALARVASTAASTDLREVVDRRLPRPRRRARRRDGHARRAYADEWAATIADPEKLARFVSFVNAPDIPDPTSPSRRARPDRPGGRRGAAAVGPVRSVPRSRSGCPPWRRRDDRDPDPDPDPTQPVTSSPSAPSTTSTPRAGVAALVAGRRSPSSGPTTRVFALSNSTLRPWLGARPAGSSARVATCRRGLAAAQAGLRPARPASASTTRRCRVPAYAVDVVDGRDPGRRSAMTNAAQTNAVQMLQEAYDSDVASGRVERFRVGVTAARKAEEQVNLLERRGAQWCGRPRSRSTPTGSTRSLRTATEEVLDRSRPVPGDHRHRDEVVVRRCRGVGVARPAAGVARRRRNPGARAQVVGALRRRGLRELWSPESEDSTMSWTTCAVAT